MLRSFVFTSELTYNKKGLLLKARWISEGDRMDFNDVVSHFTDAIKVSKTWVLLL